MTTYRIRGATSIVPTLGHRSAEPYDAAFLRGLEQQVDEGDAVLVPIAESWAFTHRWESTTGAIWLVYVEEVEEEDPDLLRAREYWAEEAAAGLL